ncbi:hypothetical protein [Sphingomonas sp. G-3-2-10]|uniref:hypothetical protein n=1 Tax=Sphingomonas sp. G-3-2-10 TaxID=2728838 RepID=UPI00146E253C|nr:hypothetical protein [Sphingomonas sp. G-3-2-10]NML06781.1 hypothetical protein [Sphingomonas sp. G-3-2-10]
MTAIVTGTPAEPPGVRAAGGRRAIAGFLFQILRSLQLGMQATARFASPSGQMSGMILTLEPAAGGDVSLNLPDYSVIEQIKIRRGRPWTTGGIAADVLPDLIDAAILGARQRFRFVTDNPDGLAPLRQFLAWRQSGGEGTGRFRWARKQLTGSEFLDALAASAGREISDVRLLHVLDTLALEVIDSHQSESEVEALLTPMLAPAQSPEDKRHELMSRLADAATAGQPLDITKFLNLIDRDAMSRLAHFQTLPRLALRQVQHASNALGYRPEAQARLDPLVAQAEITVLSGESGQGKTWSLCQAALAQLDRGQAAILVPSPIRAQDVEDAVNDSLWLPAFRDRSSLPVIARTLWRADGTGLPWLTIYVDDVQDRTVARELARTDWRTLGIHLVISSQPRITRIVTEVAPAAHIVPIDNFTSSELRRYLETHGRAAPLETMPDDVFELLLKPIHAKIFLRLPERESWVGVTEYELFQSYWREATGQARDQYDHPFDRSRLTALAGTLCTSTPEYPWRPRQLQAVGLDEDAIRRLEAVGLLQRAETDQFRFASDRMLNWAVAEYLAGEILDNRWDVERTDSVLDTLGGITSASGAALGRRLGYVFHDLVWLLLPRAPADFVADLIFANVRDEPQEWRREDRWKAVGTVGPALLPALEALAVRDYDPNAHWDIPHHLPVAIVEAGETSRPSLAESVGRLLSGGEPGVTVALKVARAVPLPTHLDQFLALQVERAAALDLYQRERQPAKQFGQISSRYDLSIDALKTAVSAAPDWLACALAEATDIVALEQLLWCLNDKRCIAGSNARRMWEANQDRLLALLPADSKALLQIMHQFGGAVHSELLDRVPLSRDDWMSDRVMRARARLDPEAALRQLRARTGKHGWSAADWWIEDLARHDPDQLADAVLEHVGKGDKPLTELVLFYGHHPELVDRRTLDWILDRLTEDLVILNQAAVDDEDPEIGVRHPIRFLCELPHPWQFDALRERAGLPFEVELTRFAINRSGRTSRVRDTEGNQFERVLAMIGGTGYADLVSAELAREDRFGREDGVLAARWDESPTVRAALMEAVEPRTDDTYRQVVVMEALAIHRADALLEEMIRAGSPVYVNAAEMRSAEGRETESLRLRVEELVADGSPVSNETAAGLAGLLAKPEEANALIQVYLDPATTAAIRHTVIATFKALDVYTPALLPLAREIMHGTADDNAQFVASYLAYVGDAEARTAVCEWLEGLDLGTWSTSRHSYLAPLQEHADSREAVVRFLLRSREGGHLLIESEDLRLLAAHGDERSHVELLRAAYRGPDSFASRPVGGIFYLLETDPAEAFFAASRLYARHRSTDAIELMLRSNLESAVAVLVPQLAKALPSIELAISQRLRSHLGGARLAEVASTLILGSEDEQRAGTRLAGWVPPDIDIAWLADFANTDDGHLRDDAHESVRRRVLEAAAKGHLAAMAESSKPLRWARLQTVFDLVDPHLLWNRDDPTSLQPFISDSPVEFLLEARNLRDRRSKAIEDEARKADKKR